MGKSLLSLVLVASLLNKEWVWLANLIRPESCYKGYEVVWEKYAS